MDEGKLVINSVADSDQGYYSCTATNDRGRSSSASVYVSVISKFGIMSLFLLRNVTLCYLIVFYYEYIILVGVTVLAVVYINFL